MEGAPVIPEEPPRLDIMTCFDIGFVRYPDGTRPAREQKVGGLGRGEGVGGWDRCG